MQVYNQRRPERALKEGSVRGARSVAQATGYSYRAQARKCDQFRTEAVVFPKIWNFQAYNISREKLQKLNIYNLQLGETLCDGGKLNICCEATPPVLSRSQSTNTIIGGRHF